MKKVAIGLILLSGIFVVLKKEISYAVLLNKWELTEWYLAIEMQGEKQNPIERNAKIFEFKSDDEFANITTCVSPQSAILSFDRLVNVSIAYGQFLCTFQVTNLKPKGAVVATVNCENATDKYMQADY